ncbi:MAG: zinc-dependent alcohol dehydrogenase family protein [Janthinobacterium lividum]
MKAYQINQYGSLDGLTQTDLPEPSTPGPGQILVHVHTVSLNYRDLMILLGRYSRTALPAGLIPLSDGAGEVVAVGDGVSRVKTGDRVAGIFFQTWLEGGIKAEYQQSALGGGIDGMFSEYVLLSADGVVKLPDYLSYEEAATLPCAAVTAWNGLVEQGHLTAGETVLLLGTGGVSMIALQIAKMHGARVIITSSSDEKLARAKSLGADETINYKANPEWEKAVWEITDKKGVDQIVEVGGPGTLEKSLQAVRQGGHISQIGVLSDVEAKISPMPILGKSIRLTGIYVGSRAMFERLLTAMVVNQTKPIIDRVFPFAEAQAAYAYLQSGSHFGKIVIKFD